MACTFIKIPLQSSTIFLLSFYQQNMPVMKYCKSLLLLGLCSLYLGIYASFAQPLAHAWSPNSLLWSDDEPRPLPDIESFERVQWEKTGHLFTRLITADDGTQQIVEYDPASGFASQVLVSSLELTPSGSQQALHVESYSYDRAHHLLLIFTNSKRVWRAHTRGDFWVYNLQAHRLHQLGKGLPPSSLQFAKISPDGKMAAYVSEHNIYVEDLATGKRKQLTHDGTEKIINGTFDWAYEEELFCRDGFRWSPDSKSIAYWQINASKVRDYLMLNTTDSIYSFTIPVQYPKVGYNPSSARIGVVDVNSGITSWIKIPGDPYQHYLPRMEWAGNANELMIQQLNRRQDSSVLYLANVKNHTVKRIYAEGDTTWIDLNYFWQYDRPGWDWIAHYQDFLWTTEKDGWKHVYRLHRDGTGEKLLTRGNYDVIDIAGIDEQNGWLYFTASPENATQQYLYRVRLDGSSTTPEKVSPANETGTHQYQFSADGLFALHIFSNHTTPPVAEMVAFPSGSVLKSLPQYPLSAEQVHFLTRNPQTFFRVTTDDGVTMDGWIIKPANFDSTKKYPVLFYVYGEPASTTVRDVFAPNAWYQQLADAGYVIISVDNRGTPAPKGAAWRHAIYRGIGVLNIHDQAMAARKILEWPWVDTSRIAVWGWSGGGSSTQNLMFQYPDIYKTGMAVAGISYLPCYDNIYEERYMGLMPDDSAYYEAGSSINHVEGLRGHLLIVHGSGDDNVHYQNQERLINALVAHGKQFAMMEYPNRTHSISEGKGTTQHLYTLLTQFLETNCPPGAR